MTPLSPEIEAKLKKCQSIIQNGDNFYSESFVREILQEALEEKEGEFIKMEEKDDMWRSKCPNCGSTWIGKSQKESLEAGFDRLMVDIESPQARCLWCCKVSAHEKLEPEALKESAGSSN